MNILYTDFYDDIIEQLIEDNKTDILIKESEEKRELRRIEDARDVVKEPQYTEEELKLLYKEVIETMKKTKGIVSPKQKIFDEPTF